MHPPHALLASTPTSDAPATSAQPEEETTQAFKGASKGSGGCSECGSRWHTQQSCPALKRKNQTKITFAGFHGMPSTEAKASNFFRKGPSSSTPTRNYDSTKANYSVLDLYNPSPVSYTHLTQPTNREV